MYKKVKNACGEVVNQGTLVPLSLVGTILSCVVGGAVWATQIHFTQQEHSSKLEKIDKVQEDISEIKQALARIEGRLQ